MSVAAGKSTLKLVTKDFEDSQVRVNLDVNEEKPLTFNQKFITENSAKKELSTYPRCFWDANIIILTDSDSKVTFEGQDYKSGVRFKTDPSNTVEASIVNDDFTRKLNFAATDELQVISNYYRPDRSLVLRRSFLPGYAQITKQQKLKGYLFGTVSAGLGAAFVYYNIQIISGTNEYRTIEQRYSTATDPAEILTLIEKADMKRDKIESDKRKRNLSLLSFVAVYGLNIFDALKPPKLGFRHTPFDIDPYVDFDRDLIPKATIKISLK